MSKRSEAGRRARAAGQAFEELLSWQHKQYETSGRAVMFFNGTKARAVKSGGKLRFIAGPSLPDYMGAIRMHGQMDCSGVGLAVGFDAKTTKSEKSWRLSKKRAHQWDTLERLARTGGLAFIMVESRPLETAFAIRVNAGETYFGAPPRFYFEELASGVDRRALTVEVSSFGHYDWLSAVEESWL